MSPPHAELETSPESHETKVEQEFTRAASVFGVRTRGRFDHLDVVRFARVRAGDTVVEVGAGTGNFLSMFRGFADRLVALDLTPAMLREARNLHEGMELVAGDGRRLPLATSSVELVASAQAMHHVFEPLTFLEEMRRVCRPDGRVLVVDQVATERFEEAVAMTELDRVRDPSHAVSRPPSAFRILMARAGLRIVDERIASSRERLSRWMWPGEFPEERIDAVKRFISERGAETGMRWRREGDDLTYERRRIMLLAEPDPVTSLI
jgi:ubiquinone/menaquinone biosynthesis C-methylase UbiE